MKHLLSLPLLALGLFQLPTSASGAADNFNDNLLSPSLWSAQTFGGAVLSETNSRLELVGSNDSGSNAALITLTNPVGGYVADWSAGVDVNFSVAANSSGLIGLYLENSDKTQVAQWSLQRSPSYNDFPQLSASTSVVNYGSSTLGVDRARLILSFDAASKVLSFSYDLLIDDSGPRTHFTFGVDGSGGAWNSDWGMDAEDSFVLSLYGNINSQITTSGDMYWDNFSTGAVPEPAAAGAWAGGLALGLAALRRRGRKTA